MIENPVFIKQEKGWNYNSLKLEKQFDAPSLIIMTNSPWDILGVSKDASHAEIRKAFLKKCKEYHPDKTSDQDGESFITLKAAYDKLLGNDSELSAEEQNWATLWKITIEDIKKFEKEYKGSDEEKTHILDAYKEFKGDIQAIVDNVMCATVEDEDRFIALIESEIENGSIERFRKFTSDCRETSKLKRKRNAQKEAEEAEQEARKLGLGFNKDGIESLELIMRQKASSRMADMISKIEEKYVKPEKKKKTSKSK